MFMVQDLRGNTHYCYYCKINGSGYEVPVIYLRCHTLLRSSTFRSLVLNSWTKAKNQDRSCVNQFLLESYWLNVSTYRKLIPLIFACINEQTLLLSPCIRQNLYLRSEVCIENASVTSLSKGGMG